ncbi:glycogen debranching N-terminal domain-containing protein [Actinomyces ruminis]|uniref:glycogen debranching N-terminal domain-containing protein n=1 Tax=Actinomyces ruminis TaxID=1937003 RepID=UPI001C558FD0|nr:glycogen debranching N-terminal domain-containing protein [Actinomyces ruminis]
MRSRHVDESEAAVHSLQPLLHEQVILVCAPAQALVAPDGSMGAAPIQGVYHSDVRVLRRYAATVTGSVVEHLSTDQRSASAVRHLALARGLDRHGADPRTVLITDRSLSCDAEQAGFTETLTVQTARRRPTSTVLTIELAADLSPMDMVKAGDRMDDLSWSLIDTTTASLQRGAVRTAVSAPGARLATKGTTLLLQWDAEADAAHPFTASWSLTASDADAVVQAASVLPTRRRSQYMTRRPRPGWRWHSTTSTTCCWPAGRPRIVLSQPQARPGSSPCSAGTPCGLRGCCWRPTTPGPWPWRREPCAPWPIFRPSAQRRHRRAARQDHA